MAFTFKGGLHPEENKITAKAPIERMPEPAKVAIAMSQHIGVPCTPCVKKGDRVLKGQLIGIAETGLSCPVHSSVSGIVSGIEDRVGTNGKKTQYILIDNDFQSEWDPSCVPSEKSICEMDFSEIVQVIKNAGIAGMGGATFPTHFKVESAKDRVEKLIINCCECEPYITANHRLMLEEADDIIGGAKIVMSALGISSCDIAIEDNKRDAIGHMESRVDSDAIRVCTMKTKYPQGDERQLIYALDKIEIPSGKLPSDVGRIVINAETSAAIYKAFTKGTPLIERVITVTGAVKEPKNLRVCLGTSISDIVEYCGGYTDEIEKIISGGPMMGVAMWDENFAVAKGTASLIFMKKEKKASSISACIHCGKCVASCPMRLMPCYLAAFSQADDIEALKSFDVLSCVECGCCTYQCPGNVPIVQFIRVAKGKVKNQM